MRIPALLNHIAIFVKFSSNDSIVFLPAVLSRLLNFRVVIFVILYLFIGNYKDIKNRSRGGAVFLNWLLKITNQKSTNQTLF
jgi:hypothetical protein